MARDVAGAVAAGVVHAVAAFALVVLDEMTYAFKYGWLELDAVIAKLLARPTMQHVIITGRDAPAAIVWDLSETGVKVTLV